MFAKKDKRLIDLSYIGLKFYVITLLNILKTTYSY